jgi:hypothetical protein
MSELRLRAAKLAKAAMKERFKLRMATADQRNGYEVGWAEGYIARSPVCEDAMEELVEALRQIAGCESHHPKDVVAIARAAIAKALPSQPESPE